MTFKFPVRFEKYWITCNMHLNETLIYMYLIEVENNQIYFKWGLIKIKALISVMSEISLSTKVIKIISFFI